MPADRPFEQELRRAYARTVPPDQLALYEQTRLPDMDFRFFNGASLGLALPTLDGDEMVGLSGLAPEGVLTFQRPGDHPRIGLDIGMGIQDPPVVLHTVMIRMEDRQLVLVWRAAAAYPGPDWLPGIRKMEALIL
jgi:hypothetical protein